MKSIEAHTPTILIDLQNDLTAEEEDKLHNVELVKDAKFVCVYQSLSTCSSVIVQAARALQRTRPDVFTPAFLHKLANFSNDELEMSNRH